MARQKFDRAELERMLREGKSQKEIAEVFGVSKMAISKAAKKAGLTSVRQITTGKQGLSSEQIAQAGADKDEYWDPEKIKADYEKLVAVGAGKLNKHREYFMAKGENPFRGALKDILRFHDQFDNLAGLKAK